MPLPLASPCPEQMVLLQACSGRRLEPAGASSEMLKRKASDVLLTPQPLKVARISHPDWLDEDLQSTSASSGDEAPLSPAAMLDCTLNRVAGRALRIYDELYVAYLEELYDKDEQAARELAERHVPAHYEELCEIVSKLLPWAGGVEQRCFAGHAEYAVLEIQGTPLEPEVCQQCDDEWQEHNLSREQSAAGKARDALMTAVAALSCRSEQVWLDSSDWEYEWRSRQCNAPHRQHRDIFLDIVRRALHECVRGHFVMHLLQPASKYRLAFAMGDSMPRPASLLLTYDVTLCSAFKLMDNNGPLPGSPERCGRLQHFALQELRRAPEGKEGTRYQRQRLCDLRPEQAIWDLVRSDDKVLFLDAFACLAPRAEARARGLGAIVREELAGMLREAKSRGQAVVFMLGGHDCDSLAHKVYLKKPFTDYGLRIGYLRWRDASTNSWNREKHIDSRVCIGLQLP